MKRLTGSTAHCSEGECNCIDNKQLRHGTTFPGRLWCRRSIFDPLRAISRRRKERERERASAMLRFRLACVVIDGLYCNVGWTKGSHLPDLWFLVVADWA